MFIVAHRQPQKGELQYQAASAFSGGTASKPRAGTDRGSVEAEY